MKSMARTEDIDPRARHLLTHGHSRRGAHTPTYKSWAAMVQRCTNPNAHAYASYGGRGIYICSRWTEADGFVNFLADMGERPEKHTLERINNDGPYSPENCRWATRYEQTQNREYRSPYFDRGHKPTTCHPERIHRARGMCASCYQIFKNGDIPSAIRGTSFESEVRRMLEERAASVPQRKARCHPKRKYYARDMCATCYVPFRDGVVPKAIRGTDFEPEVRQMLIERAALKKI